MSDDYLWNHSGPEDPEVARLEKLLGPLAHDRPLDELRVRRPRRLPWIAIGVAMIAAAAAIVFIALPRDRTPACQNGIGFAFSGEGGAVSCGGAPVASGVLPVGGSIDTGVHEATISIADIGTARLGAHTRVRLERTDAERHQLALDRGTLHAKVIAPPRLFAVTTPNTEVVDLGCEYEVTVDDLGAGSIRVVTGIVELATKSSAIVTAPAGTSAALLAGQRPGLPVGHNANADVRAAVKRFDQGDASALAALLTAAEERDAITLIAVAVVDPAHREIVLARLVELSPPPDAEITVDTALADPAKLAEWQRDIVEVYLGVWATK